MSANKQFSKFLFVAGRLFSLLLDEDDMFSLYSSRKVLKANETVYKSATKYLSENNAVNAIFISVNLASIVYQYCYATWFMYYISTMSGIKKLYKVIFQNPILGVFFYISFYFRLIGETDKTKFDSVAKIFNLPSYDEFNISTHLSLFISNISKILIGETENESQIRDSLLLVSTILIADTTEKIPITLLGLLEPVVKKQIIENPVIYLKNESLETKADLLEWQEFVLKNRKTIEKNISIPKKKKKRVKAKLQQLIELKDLTGNVLCLDTCKERVKTSLGCFCESDCQSSLFSSRKTCYVDAKKCQKSKHLMSGFFGTYDYCDKGKSKPVCFTGLEYKDCVEK